MAHTFFLEVVTPERSFYRGECLSLMLPTVDGLYGVLAGHMPMVTAVDSGVLRYRTADGDWQFAAVGQGFAEIMPESAILLVATAERPGEIDEERARRAMERAEHRLHTASATPEEHAFSLEAVERAKARLAAKARQRDK